MISWKDHRQYQGMSIQEAIQAELGRGLRSQYPLNEQIPHYLMVPLMQLKALKRRGLKPTRNGSAANARLSASKGLSA